MPGQTASCPPGRPLEHKSGNYVPSGRADVQLAGQATCLEQMFRTAIPAGITFTATDRRRRNVATTGRLRQRAEARQ